MNASSQCIHKDYIVCTFFKCTSPRWSPLQSLYLYHTVMQKADSPSRLFSKRWRKIIQHDTVLPGYSISDSQAAQLHLHSMASMVENPYNQHRCLAPGSLPRAVLKHEHTVGWPVSAACNAWLSHDMQWPFSSSYLILPDIFSPAVSCFFKHTRACFPYRPLTDPSEVAPRAERSAGYRLKTTDLNQYVSCCSCLPLPDSIKIMLLFILIFSI